MDEPIPIGNPTITQDWRGIWYSPLPGEPDPATLEIVKRLDLKPWKIVPPRRDVDPILFADDLRKQAPEDAKVYLFIPGTVFDRFGTRHGRGGGWYDRFLSKIPRDWMRIGVVPDGKLSDGVLRREAWDEPMDWLIQV